MHFVAGIVQEKFPNVLDFVNEVTYLEKAATGEDIFAIHICSYVQCRGSDEKLKMCTVLKVKMCIPY